eukprot:1328540-Pyramimonas_sp.AAC.1
MAIPPPMYSRSAIEHGRPSPSSDPLSSLWRVQMEHLSLPRDLTTAGLASSSRTRMGASNANLLFSIPAQ